MGYRASAQLIGPFLGVLVTCAIPHLTDAQTASQVERLSDPTPVISQVPVSVGLAELVNIGLERSPTLRQAQFNYEAARARAFQAGLYPNPTVQVSGEELGGRFGPGGLITAPQLNQEIVTGGKLGLSRLAAERGADQADLEIVGQRFELLTAIRKGYFDVLAAQRRVEILTDLLKRAVSYFDTVDKLRQAGEIAAFDVIPFVSEQNRLRGELEASEQDRLAAWRRLAAVIGVPDLPATPVAGSLEAALPDYDFDRARSVVAEIHPDIRSAQVGITRAEFLARRAQVEPIPNVTMGFGYQRDNMERQNEWRFQVGLPVPVWNRNQGNTRATQADLGRAVEDLSRVRNDLLNRLATAFGQYSAARRRAEFYEATLKDERVRQLAETSPRDLIRPLKESAQVPGLFQAQRALQEANLEYIRARADAWRAASEIAGLLLEEQWPGVCCVPTAISMPPSIPRPANTDASELRWQSRRQ